MKTIDRYVLSKVLWPLTATLAIAVFALLLERLVRLLDLVVTKGSPLSLVLKMLTSLIPHYIGIALPAAFFVAVLLAIMQLSRNSELYAIQAAGIGLRRILIPILGLAVVLTICSAFTLNYLQPYSRYAYRAFAFTLTNSAWDAAVDGGSFFTGFQGKTILVEGVTKNGGQLSGIFLHREKPSGGSLTITAEEGQILRKSEDFQISLRLHNGVRAETKAAGATPNVVKFEQFDVPLDLAFDLEPFHPRGGDEEELTLAELWAIWDHPPPGFTAARIGAEINSRLVRIVTILVLPFLAVPLGMASRRQPRNTGLVVGVVLLVLYHYVLQFGYSLTEIGRVSPGIGLWLPFAIFASASILGFYAAVDRPEQNSLSAALVRIGEISGMFRIGVSRLWKARQ